jgi:hypothetical protein
MHESARIRNHIEGALELVASERAAPPLRGDRRARRTQLANELRRYVDAGRFPVNDFAPDRMLPAFIDGRGTRCAMAHLIEQHDGAALVANVARDANHGLVRELALSSDLRAWLDAWGLSIEEAARIQPGYCWTPAHCTCVNVNAAKTVLEVQDGRVVKVHGKPTDEAVGDAVDGGSSRAGTFLVVPYVVTMGDRTERRLEWKRVDDGTVTCGVIDKGVKKEHAIQAILSSNCHGTLEKIDPKYVKECRPFKLGAVGGFVVTALGAAVWIRRRQERTKTSA